VNVDCTFSVFLSLSVKLDILSNLQKTPRNLWTCSLEDQTKQIVRRLDLLLMSFQTSNKNRLTCLKSNKNRYEFFVFFCGLALVCVRWIKSTAFDALFIVSCFAIVLLLKIEQTRRVVSPAGSVCLLCVWVSKGNGEVMR